VGPRVSLDGCGTFHPDRGSIPGPSSPKGVTMPTELSRPTFLFTYKLLWKCCFWKECRKKTKKYADEKTAVLRRRPFHKRSLLRYRERVTRDSPLA